MRNEGRKGHDRGRLACRFQNITNGIMIWVMTSIGKEKEIRGTNHTREQGVKVKTGIEPGGMCAVERVLPYLSDHGTLEYLLWQ
jgi:hypothetical protein